MFVSAKQSPDPVGHPAGYKSFEQVRAFDRAQEPTHGTVFLNAEAASIKNAGEPYPYGSVLVVEWRKGKEGEIARLDVMRKEKGYGVSYGADRNGDWEYASYSPEGKLITDAAQSLACAKCHLKAGASKDFAQLLSGFGISKKISLRLCVSVAYVGAAIPRQLVTGFAAGNRRASSIGSTASDTPATPLRNARRRSSSTSADGDGHRRPPRS